MKISIITVCFNSEATIRDTIESVLGQDYADLEYIIVDGASTDGTLAIIDEYRDHIATVVSEPDCGIYDAMNKGINLATGNVVGILNSDDFYIDSGVVSSVLAGCRRTLLFLLKNPVMKNWAIIEQMIKLRLKRVGS